MANNGVTRSIKAQISQGTIPNGVSLLLEASAPSMYGSANQGQSTGQTSINYTPQAIITGIGNCYTGDGTNRGHELTFQLNISNFNEIEAFDETEFTILYTITDN